MAFWPPYLCDLHNISVKYFLNRTIIPPNLYAIVYIIFGLGQTMELESVMFIVILDSEPQYKYQISKVSPKMATFGPSWNMAIS